MKVFIDDGTTYTKMVWTENKETKKHIIRNDFHYGWSCRLNGNYTIDGDQYTFGSTVGDTHVTYNASMQYSTKNTLSIHHALLTSGITQQPVDVVVTLPLSEYYDDGGQIKYHNIERKKKTVMEPIQALKGACFEIKRLQYGLIQYSPA